MQYTSTELTVLKFYDELGFHMFKPSWPAFIGFEKQKEIKLLFVVAKRVGDRLSREQYRSFQMLTAMGFKIEVAIINKAGKIQRVSFEKDKEKLKIPKGVFMKEDGIPY